LIFSKLSYFVSKACAWDLDNAIMLHMQDHDATKNLSRNNSHSSLETSAAISGTPPNMYGGSMNHFEVNFENFYV
jgi:hypothetical protein